jgi:hypothetical protein
VRLPVWQSVDQCAAVLQCAAMRAAICGSAHDSVRAVRMAVCGSALGSVCQCTWQCAAVRSVVYGSARGSSVVVCGSAAVWGCEVGCGSASGS